MKCARFASGSTPLHRMNRLNERFRLMDLNERFRLMDLNERFRLMDLNERFRLMDLNERFRLMDLNESFHVLVSIPLRCELNLFPFHLENVSFPSVSLPIFHLCTSHTHPDRFFLASFPSPPLSFQTDSLEKTKQSSAVRPLFSEVPPPYARSSP